MARIAVDDSLGNTTEQLVYHGCLVFLGYAVKGFLNNVATKSIHAERKRVTTNGLGNSDYLLMGTVLEAALDQEIAKAVDHQSVCLRNDCFDNLVLLLRGAYFELLLKKDGSLLIIIADDFVNDILPVAAHVAIQQPTVVHGLHRGNVLRSASFALGLSHHQSVIKMHEIADLPVNSMEKNPYRWGS